MNRPQYWKDELNRELIRLRRLLDGVEPESNGPEDLVMRSMALEKFAFGGPVGQSAGQTVRRTAVVSGRERNEVG